MKLIFKQQPYQTDATMAVVRCFEGQSKGFRKEVISRKTLDHGLFGTEVKVEEIFSNKKLEITESDILKNVQTLQKEQGLKPISKLDGLNFTIEMGRSFQPNPRTIPETSGRVSKASQAFIDEIIARDDASELPKHSLELA